KNVPTIVDEASLFTLLPGMLFDFMAIQINGEKAVGEELIINITLTDIGEKATLILKNGALTNRLGVLDSNPTSTIAISKIDLTKALINPSIIDQLSITGDRTGLIKLLSMMDKSNPKFNIIEP
ncbi:MAG: alkyl sulfatase C-terminal domain-containing protein, partial [Muribaculaceae bacterium]